MKLELDERDERIATLETTLGGVSQETVALNTLLAEQQERRDQLMQVEQLFDPTEAEVLRTGNSVVLRLVGLQLRQRRRDDQDRTTGAARQGRAGDRDLRRLASSRSKVTPIRSVATNSNLELSQRRADAVRAYLLASMELAPYRISAMGYGETRPIASNETADGRVRNRRIDLVISRSGD